MKREENKAHLIDLICSHIDKCRHWQAKVDELGCFHAILHRWTTSCRRGNCKPNKDYIMTGCIPYEKRKK